MIEVYVSNNDHPEAVEKTVKDLGYFKIEHADDVTCIYLLSDERLEEYKSLLDVIHVRGN